MVAPVHPEVVALGGGIASLVDADPHDLLEHRPFVERSATQRRPIGPLATGDHVVNGGEGETLVVQVPVLHRKCGGHAGLLHRLAGQLGGPG